MNITQAYTFTNKAIALSIGADAFSLAEDLSNIVDLGVALDDLDRTNAFQKALTDVVAKQIFDIRSYKGRLPSLRADDSRYGSVMQKITAELPDFVENESLALTKGASYDPNIYNPLELKATYYNLLETEEIDYSIEEDQLNAAFTGPEAYLAYVSLVETQVANAVEVKFESFALKTIANLAAESVYKDYAGGTLSASAGGPRAINVLKKYNDENGTSLTADVAMKTPDFIRYVALLLKDVKSSIQSMSKIFNVDEHTTFTAPDRAKVAMFDYFASAADVYLQSSTFHDTFTKLPEAETVHHWQAMGTSNALSDRAKVHVVTASNHTVEIPYLLAVVYDEEAAGVWNKKVRYRMHDVVKGRFTNGFVFIEARWWNYLSANAVAIFLA